MFYNRAVNQYTCMMLLDVNASLVHSQICKKK